MKNLFTALILLTFLNAQSQTDTLRHYNPQAAGAVLPNGYSVYAARFEPSVPGFIKKIVIKLGGTGTADSAVLRIFGHEGGTAFPQLEKELISPITIKKTVSGTQFIEVTLPTPLFVDNNQFFIAVTNKTSGLQVFADVSAPVASCSSSSGGDYYFLFYKNTSGQWFLGTRKAMAVDVIMELVPPPSVPWFTDVTSAAGIALTHSNRSISWADYNGDGFLDLLAGNVLYKNNKIGGFTNVNSAAGISGNANAHLFIDMNNDGKTDVLFLSNDSTACKIFVNNGDGTFASTPLNLSTGRFRNISSVSIADINNDHYPDLFVGQLWEVYPDALPNHLYLNDQALGFTDAGDKLYPPGYANRRSRGSSWVDFDDDGDQDLFVANYYLEPDEFYRNNGDGTFTNIQSAKGLDLDNTGGSGHGTGVDWADYDNDGDMDLLLPQLAHPPFILQYDHRPTTIYDNSGSPGYNFTNKKGTHGIAYEETHAGAAWGDINNDGLADIVTTTFYGCRFIDFHIQKPDHTFEMRSYESGLDKIVTGEDGCWVDFDNDGKLDLACGDNGAFRLYKNTGAFYDHFTELELRSSSANFAAIGARVKVYAGGKQLMQEVTAGRGVIMQKPARLHFGLGNTGIIDSVVVSWPGKTSTEKFTGISADNLNFLTEGGQVTLNVPGMQNAASRTFSSASVKISPNPFHGNTVFLVNFSSPAEFSLDIYSVSGQKIKSLHNGKAYGNETRISWDGSNESGIIAAPGIYYYRLVSGIETKSGTIVVE
jgi:hypothetical protein